MKIAIIGLLTLILIISGCSKEQLTCGTITAKYIRYNGYFIDVQYSPTNTQSINVGLLHYYEPQIAVGNSYCH